MKEYMNLVKMYTNYLFFSVCECAAFKKHIFGVLYRTQPIILFSDRIFPIC